MSIIERIANLKYSLIWQHEGLAILHIMSWHHAAPDRLQMTSPGCRKDTAGHASDISNCDSCRCQLNLSNETRSSKESFCMRLGLHETRFSPRVNLPPHTTMAALHNRRPKSQFPKDLALLSDNSIISMDYSDNLILFSENSFIFSLSCLLLIVL